MKEITQEIRYCTTDDGVNIAYATSGSGPPLVKAANWLNHLEFDWESPVWRHFVSELSSHFTLVRYDARGNGMSDWEVDEISFEAFVKDLEAVVETVGLEKFALLGISQGCPVSVAYTVRNPGRVDKLVLLGGFAAGSLIRSPAEREAREAMLTLVKTGWGKDNPAFRQAFTSLYLPDAPREVQESWNELQRIATPAENAFRIFNISGHIDVRDLLPQVSVPTLVLHSQGELAVPFDCARELAASIPDARLVALDSRNHVITEHEPAWAKLLTELNKFLGVDAAAAGPSFSEADTVASDGQGAAARPGILDSGTKLRQYRIEKHIASGGMGAVYRALDTNLQRPVALKVLPQEFREDAQWLARFEREARMLAAVNHPNISAVYDLQLGDAEPFIVMELADGHTLSHWLLEGPLPIDEALDVALQIAKALQAAHVAGVVHRDLKPANVILSSRGVKVLDFGLAKPAAAEAGAPSEHTKLTDTGVLMGTGPYMSPEQVRGKDVDKRTDVWAFGCVLYEMLCGRSPFDRETLADTLSAVLEAEPRFDRLPADTPEPVRALLEKALQKDLNQRLGSIGEAGTVIGGVIAGGR